MNTETVVLPPPPNGNKTAVKETPPKEESIPEVETVEVKESRPFEMIGAYNDGWSHG